jgi:hypothetical protein
MHNTENEPGKDETTTMHHREITLADGRYMIFYTFGVNDSGPDDEGDDV